MIFLRTDIVSRSSTTHLVTYFRHEHFYSRNVFYVNSGCLIIVRKLTMSVLTLSYFITFAFVRLADFVFFIFDILPYNYFFFYVLLLFYYLLIFYSFRHFSVIQFDYIFLFPFFFISTYADLVLINSFITSSFILLVSFFSSIAPLVFYNFLSFQLIIFL